MPRWNIKKKTSQRKKAYLRRVRNARRRRLYRRRRVPRSLPVAGVGKSKIARLRYCDEVTLNPAAGGVAYHFFAANGIYDPDITGVGNHQPLGTDIYLGALYDYATVIGSKIKVTPMNNGAGTGTPGYFGVTLDNNTTFAYTSAPQILESKQGRGAVMVTQKSINGNQRSAWRSFSAKKFFGVSSLVGQDEYKNSAVSNPSDGAYFGLWNAAIGTNDPDATIFMVEIEYLVVFTEPTFIAQS